MATDKNRHKPAKKVKKKNKPDSGKAQIKKKATLNKEAILLALEKSLGIVTTACKAVGIHRSTFYDYYNSDKEFKQKVDDLQEVALDFAESKLLSKVDKGDTTAIIFYLKTKGKARGYVEKQMIEADVTNRKVQVEFI